ncbi:MAG: helix-turn-helix domain-containing protein [Vampirovibrionia bacterium]
MANDLAFKSTNVQSCSYQHLHGVMLVNLNKLSYELKLTHSEYRLMGVLIGYWNKQQGKAFPNTRTLAKQCRMSNSTVLKALSKLCDLGLILILKDGKNSRQNYHINPQKFLNSESNTHATACSSTHDNKQIKNKTNIKLSSCSNKTTQNDDEIFKTTDITTYKQLIAKLDQWKFIDAKSVIKKYGLQKIQQLIKIVENNNPKNKGAYLRTLLETSDGFIHENNKIDLKASETSMIESMLKCQYWKHVPSGEILKAKPDIGKHLLIKYYKQENMVMFIENGLIDKLENFALVSK